MIIIRLHNKPAPLIGIQIPEIDRFVTLTSNDDTLACSSAAHDEEDRRHKVVIAKYLHIQNRTISQNVCMCVCVCVCVCVRACELSTDKLKMENCDVQQLGS